MAAMNAASAISTVLQADLEPVIQNTLDGRVKPAHGEKIRPLRVSS
jgi:hypothetical protein